MRQSEIIADSEAVDMIRVRYWHHQFNEMLKKQPFKVPVHLAFGHEAAAVAMDRTMHSSDRLCLSHRNSAYNLARCKSFSVVLENYKLSRPLTMGAHMGSMNLAIEDAGIAYTSSILGNNLAVASGIAMHRVLIDEPSVVFVVTGDGAMEEGVFWEALIFSRSHQLPIVIVVENNNMSMSSIISQRRIPIGLSQVCTGVGVTYFSADGASLQDTKIALNAARESAIAGLPACVELNLTTFCQHAGPTPGWPDDPLKIAIEDGLLVENSPKDPLYRVQNIIGVAKFQQLSKQILQAESNG